MSMEPKDDYGPAMLACTPMERAFVEALLMQTDGTNLTEAAIEAGYGKTYGSSRVLGHRVVRKKRIRDAIKEEAEIRMQALPVLAVNSLTGVLKDKTHKDHLKAALALMNRVGLHEIQETVVHHKHELSYGELVAELKQISARIDVPLPIWMDKAVDAEFAEVSKDQAQLSGPAAEQTGLEDLL